MKFVASQMAYFLTRKDTRRNIGRLLGYCTLVTGIVVLNTALFHVIMFRVEGQSHSWISGLYWTLVTMTTLGFGDIVFESDLGRLFSAWTLISGVVLLLVVLPFMVIRLFIGPWLEARVHLRAPREAPAALAGHVVICDYDTIAPGLIDRLRYLRIPYLVLEPDPARAADLVGEGVQVVTGEVDSRSTFEKVRVEQARLVLANLADTTNTNITLTVREISESVPVAAIVSDEQSIDILELSGCTHVLPLRYRLGEHLANRVNAGQARAHVIGSYRDLLIAEFPVENTPLTNRTVRETRLREATGVNVIGVWERGKLVPARPDYQLQPSSVAVVIGTKEQMTLLDELLVIYQDNVNPVVIIGGGKVGRSAARALKRQDIGVHIVERRAELLPRIGDVPDRIIVGDAADRRVLEEAGLLEAPSVLLTTHDDAMNIYLAVYCRRLNPKLRIVSRVAHERNLEAVLRAGADFVLSYDSLGVESVIALLQQRELIILGEGVDLFNLPVPRALQGRTLEESAIGARTGMNVIGIYVDGRIKTRIGPSDRLDSGAGLLLVGSAEQRAAFSRAYE